MDTFISYLKNKGIEPTFTKRGSLNFTFKGREFQLSKNGKWFRSKAKVYKRQSPYGIGKSQWYIVFKNYTDYAEKRRHEIGMWGLDNRQACEFTNTKDLIARIEKSGILN